MNVNRMALISADHRATRAFLAEAANVGISVEDIYEYRSFPTLFSKGWFKVIVMFVSIGAKQLPQCKDDAIIIVFIFQRKINQHQPYPKIILWK